MMFNKILRSLLLLSFAFIGSIDAGLVKPGETLELTIKGVPVDEQAKINGRYVVDDSGFVYMPLLTSSIKASSIASATLARRIESAYKSAGIYTNPRITILTARDEAERSTILTQTLTVGGFVRRSGPVSYREGMTLFDAVQTAGGANEFGSVKRVKLIRKGKMREYNLKNDKNKLIPVYPNDSIEIPQKTWLGN